MSKEDEVREASKKFYAALNRMANGDAGQMAGVWSHTSAVTAMHPIGGRQVGWEAVKDSFEKVAAIATDGEIEMKDQLISIVGDVAYELGVEQGRIKLNGRQVDIQHRVTNMYHREAGAWKMTHHHTDTSPAMLRLLGEMETQPG